MTRHLETVLLIGSTGTIGAHILKAFGQASNKFRRLAIFTSPSTVENKKALLIDIRNQGVEIIVGDLNNDEDILKAFDGFDTVISALGRNALHLQSHLIDLLASLPKLASGFPRRFYPSEYGTDIRYNAATSPNGKDARSCQKNKVAELLQTNVERPHQNKLKTRAHIEALAKEKKIEFTYIVTGPFLDSLTFTRVGGRTGYDKAKGTYGIIGPLAAHEQKIISGTTYSDTGRYVLSSLLTPDASANATLRVSSLDVRPADLEIALRKIEGKPIKTRYTSLDDFKKLEKEEWENQSAGATVYTLSRIWYEGGSDFTRKPRALYFEDGRELQDDSLASQLFKDVPRCSVQDVMREILCQS